MTPLERQTAVDAFAAGEIRMLGLVGNLTPEQWNFREAPDRWTIAENLEHVIAVERRIIRAILRQLDSGAAPLVREANPERDAELANQMRNRRLRAQAPEAARPSARWPVDQLIRQFRGIREETLQFTRATQGNLRGYSFPHMVFGDLDCYQWLIVLAGHTERHASQIEEVKTAPEYPGQSAVSN